MTPELSFTWQAWLTLGVILAVLAVLVSNRVSPDVTLVGGVTVLLLAGVLDTERAFAGMSNEGMLTVAALYVVVAGLQETGAVSWIGQTFLGRPASLLGAQLRLLFPVTTLSAVMNNTPLVAMMIPAISDWSRQAGIAASRLMIPLSYGAILGGTLSLIGTSTNLVVSGLWIESGRPALGLFEIGKVGLPCALVGIVYLLTAGRWLLPDRRDPMSGLEDARSYTVEMTVEPEGPLVGRSIEAAGLRHLPGLFLAEIERRGQIMPAVSPQTVLEGDDRLVFVGVVDSVVDLQKIRGLVPATTQLFKLSAPRSERTLVEAVVSDTCALLGRSIREGRFRNRYNAVVIAVARNGARITNQKIGDIELRAGDTLLLEAPNSFAEQQRNSRDFYLVSRVENSNPLRHERAALALAIVAGMIVSVTFFDVRMLLAAMVAAGLMIVTRCCTGTTARRSVDWQVLIVIAASFGLGSALEVTGAARVMAEEMIRVAAGDPWIALVMIYGVTMLFTELITNNAAAVLVFPIAAATSTQLGVDFLPYAMTIMMAASASFSTPIGYQTNLMVMGPGGYRFTDYFRVGIPLNLTMWALTSLLVPWIWPFNPA